MLTYQKSSSSYLYSDEEKAETRSISSKYSINRDSYNGHQYIAISPDGTQIITLNTETHQLKLCKSDNLTKSHKINYDNFRYIDVPSVKVNWSLAVSNEFTLADGTVDVLIAISCFDDDDMKLEGRSNELILPSAEDVYADNLLEHVKATTWIISVAHQSRISSSINNMGGIVKFLGNKDDDSTDITDMVLINSHGITKFFVNHETIKDMINDKASYNSWFFPDKSIENFHFPTRFFVEMKRLSGDETCNFLIQQNLAKDRFVVENYKDKVQTIEMYNLKTNLLERTFQKCEESSVSAIGKGSPCFAISNNESLFAYCRGANSITIYLMENGLEVTTKNFKERNVCILFFDFVQDDSKLLIVIEEETAENSVVVWDLFSSSDDCIRRINYTSSLFPTKLEYPQKLANSSGNLITIREDGTIVSILDDPEIIKLLNPESDNKRNIIPIHKSANSSSSTITTTTSTTTLSVTDYHLVYSSSGERLDSHTENNNGFIVKNPEPWVHNKHYKRISAYLDDDKSIQLIIGESTVQVWRKRKGDTVLEYIWTNNHTEKLRQMQIQSLEVGHREFSLTLYIPSGISPSSQIGHEIKLEWPEKVNDPVHACEALEFLGKKKDELSDQHQFEDLVQQIEHIIKKYLNNKRGLWRMLDIRFDIMSNLIRGNHVSTIKMILSSGKDKYLHIPRCYSWDGQVKETDLEISIKCAGGGYRKDKNIIKYLLDYYSDNAEKNSNWMFTVTKAIPLFYEHQLEFYVKELFQKPCFGTNAVYLEQSNICDKDKIKSNKKDIHALNINSGLIKREDYNFLQKLILKSMNKTNSTTNPSLISQVYMVPLPDFVVYPEKINDKPETYWKIPFKLLKLLIWPRGHIIKDDEKLSPFLRMIRNEKSAEIYDNPSMAAVIDFKWNAARSYFLRHALVYFIFALSFAIQTDAIKGAALKALDTGNGSFFFFLVFLSYWLGFYLLNTERIQLKYEGLKRYLSLYNFFDLISITLPLTAITLQLYFAIISTDDINNDEEHFRVFTIFNSFTILVMWMELILLLRYFERAGAYIYIIINILQQIIPFLIFILMVVLGFGHAMFVLLNNPDGLGIKAGGSTYKIVNDNDEPLPYTINQFLDTNSKSDNYFTNFVKSVESVFFWTGGRWDQLGQWDFWPVDVYSIIASILLVTILQNMLITIMGGVYEDAKEIGRHAVLKFKAELIADHETIEKPFGNKKGNPRYIYFIGKSDYIEKWEEKSRANLAEIDSSNSWYSDDNEDDNEGGSPQDPSSSPLSLYWFVDENENSKKKKDDETKMLQDQIQSMEKDFSGKLLSMEENIKHLITLLQNQQQ